MDIGHVAETGFCVCICLWLELILKVQLQVYLLTLFFLFFGVSGNFYYSLYLCMRMACVKRGQFLELVFSPPEVVVGIDLSCQS